MPAKTSLKTAAQGVTRRDLLKGTAAMAGAAVGSGVIVRTVDNGVQALRLQQPGRPDRTLSTINQWMGEIDFPEPERVRHRGADGVERFSWLYRPRHCRGR